MNAQLDLGTQLLVKSSIERLTTDVYSISAMNYIDVSKLTFLITAHQHSWIFRVRVTSSSVFTFRDE